MKSSVATHVAASSKYRLAGREPPAPSALHFRNDGVARVPRQGGAGVLVVVKSKTERCPNCLVAVPAHVAGTDFFVHCIVVVVSEPRL